MEPYSKSEIKDLNTQIAIKLEDITALENKVIEKQIEQRRATIIQLFDDFISIYDKEISSVFYLNIDLLDAALKSYYDDIYRFKEYSGSEWADRHKQAGYSVKWLSKFKPIQIIKEETNIDFDTTLTINQVFSLLVAFSFLNGNVTNNISDEYYDNLIYYLTYRNFSGKELSSIFYLLESSANGKRP